jgi:predicted dehydrogenase
MSTKNEKNDKSLKRRDFIKTGTLAAAGFMIVPRYVLGGKGYTAPSDKLNVAAIGSGGKGASDIAEFVKGGKVNIVALCDVDDREAAKTYGLHPNAPKYKDFRIMLEKENSRIDAVSVSTPDHMHAIQALMAMKMGKHVYVQKPLTHDIYEARMLTEAAKKYKVVTQMGNQGASGDGVRKLKEWYEAGVIGEVNEVHCWTNRPVWPQGISWPTASSPVPAELDWDLWLGSAPYREYVQKLVPFNWRGWWDYGTGALGDMACHIVESAFSVLKIGYPSEVECSQTTIYSDNFTMAYYPESCPASSTIHFKFPRPGKPDLKLHWMDGGIIPQRPEELEISEMMGDGGNGIIFTGDKGKMMANTYGINPRLIPVSKTKDVQVPEKYARVPEGHYQQWVDGCMAGYGNKELSSPFEIAGFLTEMVLIGNLAIRSYDYRAPSTTRPGRFDYPGRYIKLLWDAAGMKVTNFEPANQYVQREYRAPYEKLKLD